MYFRRYRMTYQNWPVDLYLCQNKGTSLKQWVAAEFGTQSAVILQYKFCGLKLLSWLNLKLLKKKKNIKQIEKLVKEDFGVKNTYIKINCEKYYKILSKNLSEEGESTQAVTIFTMGHLRQSVGQGVQKFGQKLDQSLQQVETACRNTSQNTKLKKTRFFGSQKCDLSYFL